jgi:hypothetical protein
LRSGTWGTSATPAIPYVPGVTNYYGIHFDVTVRTNLNCPTVTPPLPSTSRTAPCRQAGGRCTKKSDCCGTLKCHKNRCKKRL